MFKIIFGEIEAGWAKTTFVFNQDTLVVDISYLCDPFRDLADLGLRVLCK